MMKISARRGVQRTLLGTLVAGLVLTVLAAPSGAAGHVPSAAPVDQTAPTISGVAEYARVLTANPGTWQPANSTFTYTWRRDGGVIAGAAGSTYRIVAADINHRLSVQVVAHDGIGGTTAANSANTALVARGRFVQRARPAISGVRRWGRTLTAYAGRWSPAPTRVYYRWFRNGKPIKGAVKRKYRLRVYDFGKRIRVRILLTRANFRSAYAYSGSTGPIDHRVRLKKTFTYSISTRGRITTSVKEFARLTARTYADPRGWRAAGYGFRRVARGGRFTLVLAAAGSVPQFLFGLQQSVELPGRSFRGDQPGAVEARFPGVERSPPVFARLSTHGRQSRDGPLARPSPSWLPRPRPVGASDDAAVQEQERLPVQPIPPSLGALGSPLTR